MAQVRWQAWDGSHLTVVDITLAQVLAGDRCSSALQELRRWARPAYCEHSWSTCHAAVMHVWVCASSTAMAAETPAATPLATPAETAIQEAAKAHGWLQQ